MKEFFMTVGKWCKRYLSFTLFICIAFVVYMLFFNDDSLKQRLAYDEEIKSLKEQIKDNQDSLEYYKEKLQMLNTDPETMERIVREYYHMQRKNEDVYVFEEIKE